MELTVRYQSDTFDGMVRIGDGIALPNAFTVLIEGWPDHFVEMEVVVEDGAPVLDSLRFKRNPERGPFTSEDVKRFPLGAWFGAAIQAATLSEGDRPNHWPLSERRITDQALPRQRRRNEITPALLQEVADVYRDAVARGDYPAKAVLEHFEAKDRPWISTRTVSRWITRARKDGYLEKPDQ